MKNIAITYGFKLTGQKLNGYKSRAGAIGLFLTGLAPLLNAIIGTLGTMFPDQGLPAMDYKEVSASYAGASALFSAAMSRWGSAHKAEKLEAHLTEVETKLAAASHDQYNGESF